MEIFIGWIGLSLLVGVLARHRGQGFAGGFVWSLLLSPIIGAAITLLKKPNLLRMEMKKCPYCAELIKLEARVCRFCSRDLSRRLPPKAKAAAINRQGGTLLEQGSLEEAVTLFDQAIAIDPHLTGAMTNRGYALLRLNRLDEAETSAMQALEASSASRSRASAQVLIGKIAEARGDVQQARAHYEDALREQHGYPQAKEALAVLPLAGDDVEGRPAQPSEKEHEGTPKPVDEQTQAEPKGWVDPFGSP